MSFEAGTRLGPYEIVSAIGAGGMGEVYRARDARLERDVAVKVLPEAFEQDPERLGRFEREARAIAALSHPNILSIFDFGTANGVTYAVMELLDGRTLRAELDSEPLTTRRASGSSGTPGAAGSIHAGTAPSGGAGATPAAPSGQGLPLRRVVDIGTQVALGLAAAHDKGIVHRDLKPENVFLTTDGRVKILDFGLARAMGLGQAADGATVLGGETGTTPGTILGTFGYMAPEQVRGDDVDGRTDIFAFGALIYELLTGMRAFQGTTPADTLSAILHDDPAEARTRDGALPAALDDLVRRCLEKSPSRRFQSAHDLAFALRHVGGGSSPSVTTDVAPAARRAVRPRWQAALAAAVVLVAGFAAGRYLGPSADAVSNPTFSALTIDSGIEEWPSLSPDGSSLVYVTRATGNDDIYLRRIDGRNVTNLTADSTSDDTTPAYSPDGRLIAFRSERQGGGIFVMEATGENVKRLSDSGFNPAWSPDSRTIAYATERTADPMSRTGTSQIWVVDVASGARRKVTDGDAMQPSWSPDGQRLAVWSVDGGRRLLMTIAASGGDATPVFSEVVAATFWNPVWAPDGRWLYFVSNESGAMTLGRVEISASGRAAGPRETIVAPADWIGQIALSRDGRRLAYQAKADRFSFDRMTIDPERGMLGERTTLVAGALRVAMPSVSPDGRTIAFATVGGTHEDIFTIDRDGRHLRQVTDDAERDRGPAWTPDGSRIVFYSDRGGRYALWSINPDGSDLRPYASAPDNDEWLMPRFSGDGRLSVVGMGRSAILRIDGPSPTLVSRLPDIDETGEKFWPVAWSPDHSTIAGYAQSAIANGPLDLILFRPKTDRYERIAGAGNLLGWLSATRVLVGGDRLRVIDVATRRDADIGPGLGMVNWFNVKLADNGRTLYAVTSTTDSDIWLMTFGGRP